MSLTDKVIKNTFYHFLSQILNFLFPLFLTPFIITQIGITDFGIYALIIGAAGIFSLFDLSISTSFLKFISEYYNKKDFEELNSVINTAIIFYFFFSLICIVAGLLLKDLFLNAINIPQGYENKALVTFIVSLAVFSIVSMFSIFSIVLIGMQKMYLTSLWNMLLSVLNFISIIFLLLSGFGLYGIVFTHIFFILCSLIINYFVARKNLPEMKFGLMYLRLSTFKKMMSFGVQMQVSKLASFAADKYDEFLLAYFSSIGNVTYYNIGNRIARFGKFIPLQMLPQVAPVAAELNAKENVPKIQEFFGDTIKYLLLVSLPIFSFIILFADKLIFAWVGEGYEVSAHILQVLALGSFVNLICSAPGTSITASIGIPKYLMIEGFIFLAINLVLSFLLVKYYGILGAAYGNAVSASIAAIYVYISTARFFRKEHGKIIKEIYLKPFLCCIISILISYMFMVLLSNVIDLSVRYQLILSLALSGIIFTVAYTISIFSIGYVIEKDISIIAKILLHIFPFKRKLIHINSDNLIKEPVWYDSAKVFRYYKNKITTALNYEIQKNDSEQNK